MSTTDSSSPIRILTVDDHQLLREGIAAVIENQTDMVIVGEAASGQQALESIRRLKPDITLLDLRLPDISGIEVIVSAQKVLPKARIIVLTTCEGDAQALAALKAGASAYLLKNMLRKDLLYAIRTVQAGGRYVPPEIARGIAEHAMDGALTAREVQVLRSVAAGRSNKLIASELAISESTVKAHLKSILPKLGANDRTQAVMIALKRGILDL